jgi:hypothetical protein
VHTAGLLFLLGVPALGVKKALFTYLSERRAARLNEKCSQEG